MFLVSLFAFVANAYQGLVNTWVKNGQLGGYVHDTAMAQFIAPTLFHIVTGTWTQAAGQVAGTIAEHKAATAETATVTIPIVIPSNAVGLKGAYLKSIEVDYEILIAACTTITFTLNKVTRGADTAVALVAAVTQTQDISAANQKVVDQHKVVVSLTTPAWIANTEYYLLQISFVCPATTTLDLLGAVANFTERI
jgi:hypothetical protein